MADSKIPRIIHYCAFAGYKVDEGIINSWKKCCPDYEFMCWSEENFDVNSFDYTREAYESRKWAFVTDVARLHALYTYGGIYLDTDVELRGNFDKFLSHEAFFGYELDSAICTAVIGAAKGSTHIKVLLDEYKTLKFLRTDGSMDLTPNVEKVSNYLRGAGFELSCGYEEKDGVAIYPQSFFSPKDYATGKINATSDTVAIHHFGASWKTPEDDYRDRLFFRYRKNLPESLAWNLASYRSVMRHRGIVQGHKDMFRLLRGGKHE